MHEQSPSCIDSSILQLPSPVTQIQDALLDQKNIRLFVKRDDLIHPHLQGNKWRIHWRKQFAWFGDGTVEMIRNNADSVSSLKLDVPNDDLWFDELQLQRLETSRQ